MALPDFKGHAFETVGHNSYCCKRYGLAVRELEKSYELSLPTMYASFSKKDFGLDKHPGFPACEPRQQ